MSKFLDLVEEYNPENSEFFTDLHDFKSFLKGVGVKFGMSGDGNFYIDDVENNKTYVLQLKGSEGFNSEEEDAESINAGTGTYEIDKEVQKLADTASSGLKGMAARLFGTSAQAAKGAVAERQKLAKDAIQAYKKGSERIKKGLQAVNTNAINSTY
jgi:hypothetical protein